MNRRILIVAVLAVCLSVATFATAFAQDAGNASKAGSISGLITYTDGRPVARYPVVFRRVDKPEQQNNVFADKDGRYLIADLAEGEYLIGYFHPSRLPTDRNAKVEVLPDVASGLDPADRPVARRVNLTAGAQVTGVDFVLTDTGAERQSQETINTGGDTEGQPQGLPNTGVEVVTERSTRLDWRLVSLVGIGALVMLFAAFWVIKQPRHGSGAGR